MKSKGWRIFLLAVIAVASFTQLSAAALEPGTYVPGRVLVKFNGSVDADARLAIHGRVGTRIAQRFRLDADLQMVTFPEELDLGPILDFYQSLPEVRYAEPDFIYHTQVIPGDARFGELWGMHNTGQSGGAFDADIDGPEGWDVNTDAAQIIIGSIDTGIDVNHEDLAGNIWVNADEIPGNGVDDDSNGYIDDVNGYDFYNGDSNPYDDHSHGTHTMGTSAARGDNGIGVAGAAWSARIMALKVCSAGGSCNVSAAIAATDYATENGARLTSNSWGGGGFGQAMKDAIDRADAAGVLYIAAAGNNGSNNDASAFYPASYASPNIISVASIDRFGGKSSFSNYGATSVDLGAPGSSILSTTPGNGYSTFSGTSMACPHVTGVVANIMGFNPNLAHTEYKDIVMASVVPSDAMAGRTLTGGVLNLRNALDQTPPVIIPPGNNPPVADPGGPYKGRAFKAITFDGSGSFDPDAAELSDYVSTYVWDFGDGSVVSTSTPTTTHIYGAGNNDYVVTLTVKDRYRISGDPVTTTCRIRGGGRKAK
ncbi:MAG: S8 family serine peptidase [Acidobacteria bacterium]|uniref:S8 family serine peptidase n=1 Tax=Candidatus Polarisedimenticola svalbardensis TaxID=2886004 RepID=A0A8J6XYZ3_9BACT|nr:S8 family serine peptidase [Candidatus Polarisedimenticola svalbardensis]